MPKPKIDLRDPVTATAAAPEGVLRQIALDQITLDPITDVRTGPEPKDEPVAIDLLARSMYENGQLQPIVVRPDGPNRYRLILGHRRFRAANLIESNTKANWPILALVVERSDDAAWEGALSENIQRRNFSDIQFAHICLDVRKRKGLDGEKDWTKHVADFLHVSRATVSEKVKLLDLPEKIQARVHAGTLAADAAFAYKDTREDARDVVLADAENLAEEEAKTKRAQKAASAKGSSTTGKGASKKSTPISGPAKGTPDKPAKVAKKHILAAARKHEALDGAKPRTRTEILNFFEELTGPAYPEPMVAFATTLRDKWATGEVSDRTLINRWNTISELVEKSMKKSLRKAS